ncbi:MAG: transposase [Patescibacteria group bacterium]|jgi:putative transposase
MRSRHIYLDDAIYFVTARTRGRRKFFEQDKSKLLLAQIIKECVDQMHCKLFGWVVLSNHYHILVKIEHGNDLPKLMKLINGRSSRRLKKSLVCGLISPHTDWRVWRDYWEKVVRTDKEYFTYLNYIHHNPVKHGLANSMADYQYSSYQNYLQKFGQFVMADYFFTYPIINFSQVEEFSLFREKNHYH